MKKLIVFFTFTIAFLFPYFAYGIESGKVKGKISFGYNNTFIKQAESNIRQPESKESRSFYTIHFDSKIPVFHAPKRLDGMVRVQNGLQLISANESILFNQANLNFLCIILPKIQSELLGEIKHKGSTAYKETASLQGEYGYLSWQSGLLLKYYGEDFCSIIKYLHHREDYADKDFFDSKDHQIQFIYNSFLTKKLTGCFEGKIESSIFSKQQKLVSPEQNNTVSFQEHKDTLYELSIGSQWINGFLIYPTYTYQINEADDSAYSFYAHQLAIVTASPLFWGMTLQGYGRLRLCRFESQKHFFFSPPDEENSKQLRNELVLSLSRDIFKNYSLEMKYLLSQLEIPSSSGKYNKQSYSLTISYLF